MSRLAERMARAEAQAAKLSERIVVHIAYSDGTPAAEIVIGAPVAAPGASTPSQIRAPRAKVPAPKPRRRSGA